MKKRILLTILTVMSVATTSLSAADFNWRTNMYKISIELSELQRALLVGDEIALKVILERFKEDSSELLKDESDYPFKSKIHNMFPKDMKMKNKKHKATLAMKAARKMDANIQKIQDSLTNDKASILTKKRNAQVAYQNIVGTCFECHNLVRDKN